MIITKGRPLELSRLHALAAAGYKPYDTKEQNREDYFYIINDRDGIKKL
jgi:hypothetical protein